ncbi:MAG: hypothetical protein IKP95_07405 [Ruminococcus sp.]|nr:hypothetical protein [Ruminococcus sp.]
MSTVISGRVTEITLEYEIIVPAQLRADPLLVNIAILTSRGFRAIIYLTMDNCPLSGGRDTEEAEIL